MNTRMIAMAAAGLLAAGCDLNGNVYPLAPQQAYDKLANASVDHSGKVPFGTMELLASGDGDGTVRWNTAYGTTLCEANITPEGTDQSRIMAYCGAGGEGAAAGMTQAMYRTAIIEHIDAVLNGRPYDPRAALGSTAASWPDDPRQADGSIGVAAGEALKMDRDMHQMIADANANAAQHQPAQQQVTFKPGEPMMNVAK